MLSQLAPSWIWKCLVSMDYFGCRFDLELGRQELLLLGCIDWDWKQRVNLVGCLLARTERKRPNGTMVHGGHRMLCCHRSRISAEDGREKTMIGPQIYYEPRLENGGLVSSKCVVEMTPRMRISPINIMGWDRMCQRYADLLLCLLWKFIDETYTHVYTLFLKR